MNCFIFIVFDIENDGQRNLKTYLRISDSFRGYNDKERKVENVDIRAFDSEKR